MLSLSLSLTHTQTDIYAKFGYKICLSLLFPNTVDLTCDNQFNIPPQRRDISTKENIKQDNLTLQSLWTPSCCTNYQINYTSSIEINIGLFKNKLHLYMHAACYDFSPAIIRHINTKFYKARWLLHRF